MGPSQFQLLLVFYAGLQVVYCASDSHTRTNSTVATLTVTTATSTTPHDHELSSIDNLDIPHYLVTSDTTILVTVHSNITELNMKKEFSDFLEFSLIGGGGGQSEIWCRGSSAGFMLARVHRVHLEHIKMKGCGISLDHGGTTKAGMVIHSSTHVTIHDCTVTSPTDMGIALIGNGDTVVSNCTFNTGAEKSGLYIEANLNHSSHMISNCSFKGNRNEEGATCWNKTRENVANIDILDADDQDMLIGGAGVKVHMQGPSSNNNILVTECLFEQNSAKYGGAVYINIQNASMGNTVTIRVSEFIENCAFANGGAVAVSFLDHASIRAEGGHPTKNRVQISSCNFTRNRAESGGAVQLLYTMMNSSYSELMETRNQLQFDDCMWEENTAHYGAAIDARRINASIGVSVLPQLTLRDCKFKGNTVKSRLKNSLCICGAGTVKLKMANLAIEGTLEISGCTGSALYLESSTVDFANSSNSTFSSNKGRYGAAIAMAGVQRSAISMQGNSHILFRGNTALTMGGAIFQGNSRDCFIIRRDGGNRLSTMRAVLEFENNTAGTDRGHSVYVDSLLPCMEASKTDNYRAALESIAQFVFYNNRTHEVATPGSELLSNITFPATVIPGKLESLEVYMLDDTNTTVLLSAPIVTTESPDIDVLTGNFSIKVLGKPGSVVKITVTPHNKQSLPVFLSTKLSMCPPGYLYDIEHKICTCSSNSPETRYIGIQACDEDDFQVTLLHSHWAGYMRREGRGYNDNSSEKMVFITAYCPSGFCTKLNKTHKDIKLPSQAIDYDLSSYVCRENRAGVFCSVCTANHSAYFPRTTCGSNENCKFRVLFYILSQIIPATILFSLLLAFDLSLTSGLVGGVIFYMQMVDALLLTANGFLWFEPPVYKLLLTLRVLSRMSNLVFFAHRSLSFCLWEGATSLDIIAFNYVIVIYSFLMVMFTVKVVNPLVLRIKKFYWRQVEMEKARQSIIHGLTGFLVLCYSQNTYTSLFLLAAHTPRDRESKEGIESRVFFRGEFRFFGKEHLPYAIPALLMLLTITILPPLLLLLYPLCYRVFALCHMQESKITRVLCRVVPLEKYKPLFDSFQGSFKDNNRYFAGFYFMYRLVWLVTLAYVRDLANFYIILEIELVLMLLLTAYLQPHNKELHNRIDVCIFTLLVIINSCTIYGYHKRSNTDPSDKTIQIVNTIQVMLACLPLLSVVAYLVKMGVDTRGRQWKNGRGTFATQLVEIDLQRDQVLSTNSTEEEKSTEHKLSTNSTEYRLFKDKI